MPTRHVRYVPLALAVAASIVAAAPARASLLLALDAPTMVDGADSIAVVDVASVRAAWDERHERIVTTVEMTVVESWKGGAAPASRVVIVQPGGTVGDISMTVIGMPRFSPGERALVFLHGPPERARVLGLAQGKRTLRFDRAGGRWLVAAPDRAGASFVRKAAGARVPALDAGPRPLDEVRADIRALVGRGGAR